MRRVVLSAAALVCVLGAAKADPASDAFTAGDFAAAEQAYQATLAASPNDVAALTGLARLKLYEEKRSEARELAQRAQHLDPSNAEAKRVLRGANVRDAAFAPDVWRITMPADGAVDVSLIVTDPLPVVAVTINGAPHLFLIDTGAPDIVLDSHFANEMGLKPDGAKTGTFAGGAQAAFEHVVLPAMDVGTVHVEQVPASVLPTRGMSQDRVIDGIIGTGFLMHFLPTLNYAEGILTLRPRSASAAVEASVTEGQAVPMWLVGDHFLFVRGHIGDGPEALYTIDTGLEAAGVQAKRATLDAAHVAIDETAVQTGLGGGGMVRFIPFKTSASIGAVTVNDLNGVYTPDGDQYELFQFQVAGTISHQFFRGKTLTFDFDAMKMIVR
ncbi:MAG: aspartyl protease family protein [Alphaproteobacteria bacterium]|nr:aspartyl protease family protein [Alphaproteobacteria bacterium]MBL6938856.1 aspartyl protease family protein [Alphaproteobacteria bacterium]MBL7099448.1 aspartyl protease family protein [Alphaproteobacteria bacterium]